MKIGKYRDSTKKEIWWSINKRKKDSTSLVSRKIQLNKKDATLYFAEWLNLKRPITLNVVKDMKQAVTTECTIVQ